MCIQNYYTVSDFNVQLWVDELTTMLKPAKEEAKQKLKLARIG